MWRSLRRDFSPLGRVPFPPKNNGVFMLARELTRMPGGMRVLFFQLNRNCSMWLEAELVKLSYISSSFVSCLGVARLRLNGRQFWEAAQHILTPTLALRYSSL